MSRKLNLLNFIFVSNIYGEGPVENKNYAISHDYYYFDFKFSSYSTLAGVQGYYFEAESNIEDLLTNLNNKNSLDSKKYCIDKSLLYKYDIMFSSYYYQIIRRREYELENKKEIVESFYEKINNSLKTKFEDLIKSIEKKKTYFYKDLSLDNDLKQVIDVEYCQDNNKFKSNIP